jgi:hypothetical protein
MDCKTARLLLDFARPQACEVDPADSQLLAGHLDRCTECDQAARAQRQVDGWVGQAMRQVEVPAGLKDHILARLEVQRGDRARRRLAHGLRLVAAAAAVVFLVWLWWSWHERTLPTVQPADVWDHIAFAKPSREQVEHDFKRWGAPIVAPPDLNYSYLTSYHLAELPGHPGVMVPELIFDRDEVPRHHQARVFVVRAKQLPQAPSVSPSGAPFKMEVLHQEGEDFAYLVFHNGDNLDWLKAEGEAA